MKELAASAAYTYHLYHQDHEAMRGNVDYYRTLDGVKDEYFRDLHAKKYQVGRVCSGWIQNWVGRRRPFKGGQRLVSEHERTLIQEGLCVCVCVCVCVGGFTSDPFKVLRVLSRESKLLTP